MKALFALILASLVLAAVLSARETPRTSDGFALPEPGRAFDFPRDHGSHPEFKIEWWYLTGNLQTASGRHFGYQVTFFRRGLKPSLTGETDQIYLAHVALTDTEGKRFFHQERIARPGWDAEASTSTLDVRNGPWSLRIKNPTTNEPHPELIVVGGVQGEVHLRLSLRTTKPLVFFGDDGVSRKGDDPTAASHYLTFSRLATEGELRIGTENHQVTGTTWMDHEISSSQLDRDQVGWDWFGLHLSDGREVMLYRLRRNDGTAHPASRLTWVDAEGRTQTAPFTWEVLKTWTSPHTGAVYPIEVAVTTTDPLTGRSLRLQFQPVLEDQELTGAVANIAYWEGSCRVTTDQPGLSGYAYMELTGYQKDLKF